MKEKSTIAISPISNSYLTEGKEYCIIICNESSFTIIDDDDDIVYCLFKGCPHIKYLDWILK